MLDVFGIQYMDPMAYITTSNGLVLSHHPSLHVVSLRLRGTHSVSGSHDHLLDRARDVVGPGATLHVNTTNMFVYMDTNTCFTNYMNVSEHVLYVNVILQYVKYVLCV